jgi:hypothetical protein
MRVSVIPLTDQIDSWWYKSPTRLGIWRMAHILIEPKVILSDMIFRESKHVHHPLPPTNTSWPLTSA